MSKALSVFESPEGLEGVYVAHKGALRCTAIRLASGDLCLYSPVRDLGEDARESLAALGEVTHLLAPNHYHHMGLKEYSHAFPTAVICCSEIAKPRLEIQSDLPLTSLEVVNLPLPSHLQLIKPQGLKTGEVWIEMSLPGNLLWIVADAFCGPKTKAGAFAGRPELLGTFPKFGIANPQKYSDWLSRYLRFASPRTIIPCHGSIVSSPDLGKDAFALVDALKV